MLVDSEPLSNAVLAAALTGAGLPTSPEEAVATYKGLHISDVIARAQAGLGGPLPEGFIPEYEQARADAFRRELTPVAGAADAVAGDPRCRHRRLRRLAGQAVQERADPGADRAARAVLRRRGVQRP